MLFWLIGPHRPSFHRSLYQVVIPLFLVLACGAVATGYYYFRVTGNPLRMAYEVERHTYGGTPYFLWQKPGPQVSYHHAVMHDFYRAIMGDFEQAHTPGGYLQLLELKAGSYWWFYLEPLLTLPLLALPWVVRQKKMRLPIAICAATAAGLAVESWALPHYFAPATGALYILVLQCMRQLWHWNPQGRAIGRALVRPIPLLACAMILLRVTAAAAHAPIEGTWPRGNLKRAEILQQLDELPGPHLVIVRYAPHHNFHYEWVYNRADIDHAKVAWAREMDAQANQELLQYFRDRKVWVLEADSPSPHLVAYPD
jgi:hypothetical protein